MGRYVEFDRDGHQIKGIRRGLGTLLTSWTKFSLGSSKPLEVEIPTWRATSATLLRNSPRAHEISSFSPQAPGRDGAASEFRSATLRSSCIPQLRHAWRNDFAFWLHAAAALVHP